MKKYWIILCAGLLSMGLLAGCAGQEQNKTGQETLSAAADLIGQADADVKDLFGGGEGELDRRPIHLYWPDLYGGTV